MISTPRRLGRFHPQRACFAGWGLLLALGAALVGWVCAVPRLEPAGDGDSQARARVARAVRQAEPAFRRRALERFPGDPWSQGDDFAAQERALVERLAAREGMRVGAVLKSIDEDVKRRQGPTSGWLDRGQVAPCMPRPFYD